MSTPERSFALAVVMLCALTVILYWTGLGRTPLYGIGEAREALEVQEELLRGEWILPMRNGTELPSKPPMFHWLAGVVAQTTGRFDEFALRAPSAALATVTVLLVFWLGRRKWGTAAGIYAAVMLATSFEWVRTARSARVDMTLTACLTAAFVSFDAIVSRPRPSTAALVAWYVSLALGALAKGPVGILLPVMVAAAYLWVRRDWGRLREMRLLPGCLVAFLPPLAWYVAATVRGGEAFLYKQVLVENLRRFFGWQTDPGTPPHGPLYVLPALLSGFAPWSLLLIPVVVQAYRERRTLRTSPSLHPLLWLGLILIFFAVAAGKRAAYVLPVYPAAALLCGALWSGLDDASTRLPPAVDRARVSVAVVVSVVVLLFAAALVGELAGATPLEFVRPWLHRRDQANLALVRDAIRAHGRVVLGFALVATPLALFLAPAVRQRRWRVVFGIIVGIVGAGSLVASQVIHPRLAEPRSFKSFMAAVRGVVRGGDELVFHRHFDYGAVFYWGERIPLLEDAFSGGSPDRRRYALVWQRDWEALAAGARAPGEVLLSSAPVRDDQFGQLLLVRRPESAEGRRWGAEEQRIGNQSYEEPRRQPPAATSASTRSRMSSRMARTRSMG